MVKYKTLGIDSYKTYNFFKTPAVKNFGSFEKATTRKNYSNIEKKCYCFGQRVAVQQLT